MAVPKVAEGRQGPWHVKSVEFTKHLDAKLKKQCVQDFCMVDFSRSNLEPLLEAAEQIELVAALLSQRPKPKSEMPWKQVWKRR